ncbi:MAG: polysaccharide deacetylase family protein [Armatimonadetes bacterium]|nr:polysaccharide deacetylase family protein [Armatimonadota bacterium]
MGLLALLGRPAAGVGDAYLDLLDSATQRAEQGTWDIAFKDFSAASQLDPADPLGYLGQALSLLAGGRVDDAAALFRRAEQCGRAGGAALSGLGFCYFQAGRLEEAAGYFERAGRADPQLAAPPFYRGVIDLCRDRLDEADPLLKRAGELGLPKVILDFTQALRLLAAGRFEAAAAGLRKLQPQTATRVAALPLSLPVQTEELPDHRFRLRVPLGATLDARVAPAAAAPVVAAAQPAEVGNLTIDQPLPGAVVSGRLPIRLRLREAYLFKYIVVSVDGKSRGMTNREPFYVVWDTAQFADGPHEITARAVGDVEIQVAATVTVQNHAAPDRDPHDPVRHRSYTRRLAALLTHGLPPAAVESLLLQAYRRQDPELALDLCERVLAADPKRGDVVEQLVGLYRSQGLAIDPSTISEPHRGIPGGMRVALSFDDGPRPEYTPPILELLKQYKARATFMVTGRMTERYPELVSSIAAAGHEIGNHTYDHLRLDSIGRDEVVFQLVKTKVVLDNLLGGSARFYRPPGGHYNPAVREVSAALGYYPVFWSINCGDYKSLAGPEGAEAVMRRVMDGAILLLHNGPDNTLPMLPYLLERLRRAGFRMVTVSDILRPPADVVVTERTEAGPLSAQRIESFAGTE